MKLTNLFVICCLVAASSFVTSVNCQAEDNSTLPADFGADLETSASENHNHDVGTSIVEALLTSEFVQHKLQKLFDLLDLKIRLFRLIGSLLTRENFLLVRSVLDLVARVCNFLISFLPDPDPAVDGKSGFLASLFPVLTTLGSTTNGDEALTISSTEKSDLNEIYVGRVDRSAQLTDEEKTLLDNKDVHTLAKLIYATKK